MSGNGTKREGTALVHVPLGTELEDLGDTDSLRRYDGGPLVRHLGQGCLVVVGVIREGSQEQGLCAKGNKHQGERSPPKASQMVAV